MKLNKNDSLRGSPILGLVFGCPVAGPGRVSVSSTPLSVPVVAGKLYRICPDVDVYVYAATLTQATLIGTVAGPWDLSDNDTLIASVDGAGNQTATFTVGGVVSIDAVTAAEAKAIIEAAWTSGGGVTVSEEPDGRLRITANTPGTGGSLNVSATSTAETLFGLATGLISGTGAPASIAASARVPADAMEVYRIPDGATHLQVVAGTGGYCWLNEMGV